MSIEDDIATKKARLDALRPLTADSLKTLEAWYDIELTYTSNAIEGSTLTRSETAILVEKGITAAGKPLKDHLEAVGHMEALAYVRTLAARGEPIREGDIREIHRLILQRSEPAEAGSYSTRQRAIRGSSVTLPSPAEIPPLMGDFARWLTTAPNDYAAAFEAHYRLVRIHPFTDGNGRTARLLMNLMLIRVGYPPVIIAPEQRQDYIDSLETRHMRGDALPYQIFMMDRLNDSLARHIEHCSKELEGRPGGPAPSTPPRR